MVRSSRRILVVDDDADTCALVEDALTREGYSVRSCLSGRLALNALSEESIDLVLADIKMPQLSGIDLLHEIRETGHDTKVILMTAYASLETAIQALRIGAQDYLVKPFALAELRQCVKNAWSDGDASGQELCYGDLIVNLDARRVWVGNQEVELTRQEFDLLAMLMRRQGATVSWQELLQGLWGYDEPEREDLGTLRSCIRRVRQKIGDDARNPRYIINRWGEGYRFGV